MVFENCVKMLENGQTTALKCRIFLMFHITIILARLSALFTLTLTRLVQLKILKHFSFLLNSPTDRDLQHLPRDCSLLRKDEETELS